MAPSRLARRVRHPGRTLAAGLRFVLRRRNRQAYPRIPPVVPAERRRPLAPLPLDVLFVGRRAAALQSLAVRGAVATPGGAVPRKVDVVVVDAQPENLSWEDARRLVEECRARGARVVGITGEAPDAVWSDAADLVVDLGAGSTPEAIALATPVDPLHINPVGWEPQDNGQLAMPAGPDAELLAREVPADIVDVSGDGAPPSAEQIARLRPYRAFIDDPALHPNEGARAAILVHLAAAGVPVLARDIGAGLRKRLGDAFADAIAGRLEALVTPTERERLSVCQRRVALRDHSVSARWRDLAARLAIDLPAPPRVSVVLSTKRPKMIEHATAQYARQTYRPRELVLVLHGGEFRSDDEARALAAGGEDVRVLRVRDSATLGEALREGTNAATGDIVTKMDDDDWYGVDHLADLVLALEYSGAELVAKASEFVYLEALGETVRRELRPGAERPFRWLAGGSLTMRAADLRAVGGWRAVPRGVDQALILDVFSSGGYAYRTHGFGYVLNRHGEAHTWDVAADHFLRVALERRHGLDLEFAGV